MTVEGSSISRAGGAMCSTVPCAVRNIERGSFLSCDGIEVPPKNYDNISFDSIRLGAQRRLIGDIPLLLGVTVTRGRLTGEPAKAENPKAAINWSHHLQLFARHDSSHANFPKIFIYHNVLTICHFSRSAFELLFHIAPRYCTGLASACRLLKI